MRRFLCVTVLALVTAGLAVTAAWADSPHFVNNAFTITRDGDTLDGEQGEEAGLGDEAQIHVVLKEARHCAWMTAAITPRPSNKASVSAEGDFPVQNGKANFTLSVTATFRADAARQ